MGNLEKPKGGSGPGEWTGYNIDEFVTGDRAVTGLRPAAATTHSFKVVAADPSKNASAPSATVTATTPPSTGVFDGTQTDIHRWITYGTQPTNTFSVQAIDGAGNRSPTSLVTLNNQSC